MSTTTPRKGYKETEIGLMPEDWCAEKLGPKVMITSGESPSHFKFVNEGVPYFKVEQLNTASKYQESTPYFFKGTQSVAKGSLIFPKRGASILLNKIRILEADSFMDTNLMTLTPNEELDNEYLYYTLLHIKLWKFADTTSIPQINNKHINPLIIAVPSLPEQKAIASVLSDVDALIDSLDALIAKKKDMKQGVMHELLTGKRRLPGFSGEWQPIFLGKVGTTYGGLVGKTKKDFGIGSGRYIPFLNVLNNSIIDPNSLDKVTVEQGEGQNCAKKGDLFFNGSSETPEDLGVCAVLLDDIQNVYLNSFCFGFRPQENAHIDGLFLAYFFRSNEGRKLIYALAQGATRYNLSKTALMNLELKIPTPEEQIEISKTIRDIENEIHLLELKREKFVDLKQGMMQQLLTGNIRLI